MRSSLPAPARAAARPHVLADFHSHVEEEEEEELSLSPLSLTQQTVKPPLAAQDGLCPSWVCPEPEAGLRTTLHTGPWGSAPPARLYELRLFEVFPFLTSLQEHLSLISPELTKPSEGAAGASRTAPRCQTLQTKIPSFPPLPSLTLTARRLARTPLPLHLRAGRSAL